MYWKAANHLQQIFSIWFDFFLTSYLVKGCSSLKEYFPLSSNDLQKTGTFGQHPFILSLEIEAKGRIFDRCSHREKLFSMLVRVTMPSLGGEIEAKSWPAFQPRPSHACTVESPVSVWKLPCPSVRPCIPRPEQKWFGDSLLCFIETLVRWLIPNCVHCSHYLGLDGRGAYPRANHDGAVFPSHPEPTGNFLFLPGEIR